MLCEGTKSVIMQESYQFGSETEYGHVPHFVATMPLLPQARQSFPNQSQCRVPKPNYPNSQRQDNALTNQNSNALQNGYETCHPRWHTCGVQQIAHSNASMLRVASPRGIQWLGLAVRDVMDIDRRPGALDVLVGFDAHAGKCARGVGTRMLA